MNRKQHPTRSIPLMVAAAVLAIGFCGPSLVQAKKGGKSKKQQQPQQPAPATPAPTATPDASSSATKDPVPQTLSPIETAEREVTQAQTDLDAFVMTKKTEFENNDQIAAAKDAVAKDIAALDALVDPLREKLKETDTDYALSLEEIVAARQKLADATAAKKSEELGADRAGVKYFQEIITKAEAGLLADPAVKKARAQLDADKAKLTLLENGFQKSLDVNADYRALTNALDNAHTGLTKAQTAAAGQ